jgi:hypothetical protein
MLATLACSQGAEPRESSLSALAGVWQFERADVASGLGESYRFYSDGRFEHHANETECSARALAEIGRWSTVGDDLQLEVERRVELTGGTVESATGGCASETEIVGARADTVVVTSEPPRRLRLSGPDSATTQIYSVVRSQMVPLRTLRLSLNQREYWRLSADPEAHR